MLIGLYVLGSLANDEYSDDYYYDEEGNKTKQSGNNENNSQQTAAGEDEYEGYEEPSAVEAEVEADISGGIHAPPPQEVTYGFIRSPGGGLMKISKQLVDDEYLNHTRDYYECLKLEDLVVPIVEADEMEEPEISIEQQLSHMKSKLNSAIKSVMSAVDGTGRQNQQSETEVITEEQPNAQNATDSGNATASGDSKKRMTFREKQALRMKERQEKEAQRELVKPKYRLGADCETLICGACKAVVEEFGYAVAKAVPDPNIKYIDQVTEGFCSIKPITLKYREIVADMCKTFDKV